MVKILKSISKIILCCFCLAAIDVFSMEVERRIAEIGLSSTDEKVLKSIKGTADLLQNKEVSSEIIRIVDSLLAGESKAQLAVVKGVSLSKVDTINLNAIKAVAALLQDQEIKNRFDHLINDLESVQKKPAFEKKYDINELMESMEKFLAWKDEKQKVLEIAGSKTIMQALENSKQGTLLMLATDWDSDIVESFINAGLNPNIKTQLEHEYPLHNAAAAGRGDMIAILLFAGAENKENSKGNKPYDLAEKKEMDVTIKEKKKQRENEGRAPLPHPWPYDKNEYDNAVKAVELLK